MRFRDLYAHIDKLDRPPVKFDTLADIVRNHHLGIGTVKVWAVKYLAPTRQAHYRMVDIDRTSAYNEEFGDVEITYCEALDDDPLERRYALTKELMHVFDSPEQRVDSKEKFVRLLKDIQNKPMPPFTPAFGSELDTRWMAAIALCPKRFRDDRIVAYRSKRLEDFDISKEFRIPEWVVSFVMDDYYNEAFDLLMTDRPTI